MFICLETRKFENLHGFGFEIIGMLLRKNFDGDKSYNDFPRYSGVILRTREELQEFKDFFEPLKNDPSLTRAIEMGEREISGRIELIERDKQQVEDFLMKI